MASTSPSDALSLTGVDPESLSSIIVSRETLARSMEVFRERMRTARIPNTTPPRVLIIDSMPGLGAVRTVAAELEELQRAAYENIIMANMPVLRAPREEPTQPQPPMASFPNIPVGSGLQAISIGGVDIRGVVTRINHNYDPGHGMVMTLKIQVDAASYHSTNPGAVEAVKQEKPPEPKGRIIER